MYVAIILALLKLFGATHLSWLGVIGYGILIEFILAIICAILGD